jgi:hypothetical protein
MTANLLALAERCEAATGPDRELDAQIIIALEHPEYHFPDEVLNRKPSSWDEAAGRFRHDGSGGSVSWPAFTASVDAALTLVPEGWNDNVSWSAKKQKARAWCEWMPEAPFAPSDWIVHYGRGANRALAICAAALRARAAQ